jgi:hypothetical protein
MFILYCAEVPQLIKNCSIAMFADDVKLYYVFPPGENSDVLQYDCNILVEWAKSWQLSLATSKCSVLHIGKNNPNKPYFIGTSQLVIAPSPIRDLGILIRNDLNFNDHISSVCRSANGCMYSILKAIRCHDKDVLLRAFLTYVRPLLEFSSSVFNPHIVYEIEAIEKVQRDFTSILFYRCFPG